MRTDIDYRDYTYRRVGFDKFYEFHISTNDCSPDIAVEKWIADNQNWDFEKRCVMALFHGATYAGPCETMFADKFPVFVPEALPDMIKFFQDNKHRLLFSPDCKYRKMVFEKFLESVARSITNSQYKTLGGYIRNDIRHVGGVFANQWSRCTFENQYLRLQEQCMRDWYHWGRMGHWCFAEALHRFVDAPIMAPTMEFGPGGKSHTAGWAFCIGRDDLVSIAETLNYAQIKQLEESANYYISKFKVEHPELKLAQYFTLETACCNYKRQHKGSRYGGCYIDEQYDEITYMKNLWPEYNWLWDLYMQGRQAVIPASLLFENFNKSGKAYMDSWCNALKEHGRIPRIEAWHNKETQEWKSIEFMPWSDVL